nr:DUF6049 family protein [Haloactinomyces albus]
MVSVLLLGLVPVAAPTATAQSARTFVTIDVTKVTPSIVRADSPSELTVSGTLTNTGNRTIDDLEMRVQRGAPRATEASVREALRGSARTAFRTRFTDVVDTLSPGEQTPFTLHIPIAGGADSLRIAQAGVYPVLLNVNGVPAYGNRARVADTHFLLPVAAPPGGTAKQPAQPTPVTMLLPLVGYPKVERAGTLGRPAILVDDRLSQSLAPGGRLFELVDAVSKKAGPGSPLGKGLCFAIDPALVATVHSMADGYRVRQDDGSLRQGSGTEAAKRWLDKLRGITRGRCVIALPYSDADIVALGRAGLPDLISGALDSAGVIRRVLGVEPRGDVLWPIDGALDEPAATQLSAMGIDTLLMHPQSLALPESSLQPVRVKTQNAGHTPAAQPVDPLLSRALDPRGSGGSTTLSSARDTTLSAQNTLGALTFRATVGADGQGATSVLAPPRRWNPHGQDLTDLLTGLERLTEAGYVQPTGLPDPGGSSTEETDATASSEQAPSGSPSTPAPSRPTSASSGQQDAPQQPTAPEQLPTATLTYPVSSATEEIRRNVLDTLAAQNHKLGEFHRAAERDPALDIAPVEVTTPLRNGLLRGASSAWRGDPAASRRWVSMATETLENTLSGVRIDEFGGQISLTSSNSPIPVTVNNRLPVTVGVNLHVDSPPGITVTDLGLLKIPARGSRQFWLDTEVNRSGKFSVDITIRTEGGTQLGSTRRIQMESNAYGTMPLLITVIGAALLVLLSARRLVRRARANRANVADDNRSAGEIDDRPEEKQPMEGGSASSGPESAAPRTAAEDADAADSNQERPDTEHGATTERDQDTN